MPDLSILASFSHGPDNHQHVTGNIKRNEKGFFDVPLKLIEEDPDQPREEDNFNPEAIRAMADTIETGGLGTPISLRRHPNKPDMYMINYGARRFRAFHMLKRKTIPAIFDESATKAGQIIENIHREPLNPKAILKYVGECLQKGMKAKEIAESIKLSPAYITMYKKLLDIKTPAIKEAFDHGRLDVTVAYDMVSLAKDHEQEVIEYLAGEEGEITQSMAKKLRQRFANPPAKEKEREHDEPESRVPPPETANFPEPEISHPDSREPEEQMSDATKPGHEDSGEKESHQEAASPQKPAKPQVFGEYKGEIVVILSNKMPSAKTKAVIKTRDGEEKEVPIKNLALARIWSE